MKAYHFTNSKFDKFDDSFLGSYTIERGSNDENFMAISMLGFCFVEEDDIEALTDAYGDSFGAHIIECELDVDGANLDSTYDDFCDWIERDGADSVREQLKEEGCKFVNLWNGFFSEILVLDSSDISISRLVR